jgi:hypothetical protein
MDDPKTKVNLIAMALSAQGLPAQIAVTVAEKLIALDEILDTTIERAQSGILRDYVEVYARLVEDETMTVEAAALREVIKAMVASLTAAPEQAEDEGGGEGTGVN